MADVFISYTKADRATAQRLADMLRAHGRSVFFDANLTPGDTWDRAIERELKLARAVIVLWSTASVDRPWVRNEARLALSRGILCPAMLDACEIPVEFSHAHAAQLVSWAGDATHEGWVALRAAVEAKLDAPTLSDPSVVAPARRARGLGLGVKLAIAAGAVFAAFGLFLAGSWIYAFLTYAPDASDTASREPGFLDNAISQANASDERPAESAAPPPPEALDIPELTEEESPSALAVEEALDRAISVSVRRLRPADRVRLRMEPDQHGVIITVLQNEELLRFGVHAGDAIVYANGLDFDSPAAFERLVTDARQNRQRVRLSIYSNGSVRDISLLPRP